MFLIFNIPEELFGWDRKMQRYVDNELFPFLRQIVKVVRENDGDNLLMKIDNVKNMILIKRGLLSL